MAQQPGPFRKKKRPIGFNVSGSTDDTSSQDQDAARSATTDPPSPDPELDEKALSDLQELIKKVESQTGVRIENLELKGAPGDLLSQKAAEAMNRRVFSKLQTKEEKERLSSDRDNPANHPRFKEWQRWIEQQHQWAREAKLEEGVLRLPSFQMWLVVEQQDKKREPNRPRIRSANPPEGNIYHANKFFNKTFRPGHARDLSTPWKLFTYLKTFPTILSTGARLEITLWFSIPESRRDVSDELHSVTHRELLTLMKDQKARPEDFEIQDFLHCALVPFQNERDIPILKVSVTPDPNAKPADETGIPAGYITHIVTTSIGIITYAYRPTVEGFPDIFFEAEADKALIQIVKNNATADLRSHQKSLRIIITRIDPKKRTIGFGPPVGDAR